MPPPESKGVSIPIINESDAYRDENHRFAKDEDNDMHPCSYDVAAETFTAAET